MITIGLKTFETWLDENFQTLNTEWLKDENDWPWQTYILKRYEKYEQEHIKTALENYKHINVIYTED